MEEDLRQAAHSTIRAVYEFTDNLLQAYDDNDDVNVNLNIHSILPRWPIILFLCTGALCCLFSATYHLLSAVNEEVSEFFQALDYAGICILIGGSNVPLTFYAFYCQPEIQMNYLILHTIMSISGFIIVIHPKFNNYTLRTWTFVILGFFGFIPMIHIYYTFGYFHQCLIDLLIMGVYYLLGALMYALHIPERWFPGKFDICGNSHQWFHLLVVIAIFKHYFNMKDFYLWRMNHTCTI